MVTALISFNESKKTKNIQCLLHAAPHSDRPLQAVLSSVVYSSAQLYVLVRQLNRQQLNIFFCPWASNNCFRLLLSSYKTLRILIIITHYCSVHVTQIHNGWIPQSNNIWWGNILTCRHQIPNANFWLCLQEYQLYSQTESASYRAFCNEGQLRPRQEEKLQKIQLPYQLFCKSYTFSGVCKLSEWAVHWFRLDCQS